MFSKTAKYYDLIYDWKDYEAETSSIKEIVAAEKRSPGQKLLDIACGTGAHLALLQADFEVAGLDLDKGLLDIARQKVAKARFFHGDMIRFDLGQQFDVILCLFSSIGYVRTLQNLHKAISCMANHLVPGGLLIIEPWFTPDKFYPGTPHAKFIDEPELKIARVNTSFIDGKLSYFDMHYLISTSEGTEHFVERHELGLFTVEEMTNALEEAGLETEYQEEGLMGRGLYIGRRRI